LITFKLHKKLVWRIQPQSGGLLYVPSDYSHTLK
jgi:hypothetical protein